MKTMPKVVRTSAGLRDCLFDELDRLRAGETSPMFANAVARLGAQVVNTVSMEIEIQKLKGFQFGKPIPAVPLSA